MVHLRTDKLDLLVLAIVRIALTAPTTVIEPAHVADAIGLLADGLRAQDREVPADAERA